MVGYQIKNNKYVGVFLVYIVCSFNNLASGVSELEMLLVPLIYGFTDAAINRISPLNQTYLPIHTDLFTQVLKVTNSKAAKTST